MLTYYVLERVTCPEEVGLPDIPERFESVFSSTACGVSSFAVRKGYLTTRLFYVSRDRQAIEGIPLPDDEGSETLRIWGCTALFKFQAATAALRGHGRLLSERLTTLNLEQLRRETIAGEAMLQASERGLSVEEAIVVRNAVLTGASSVSPIPKEH